MIWNVLLNVAEQVRDGTRIKHCNVIAQKQAFYHWVEERCQFMLQNIKEGNNETNENNNPQSNMNIKDPARTIARTCRTEEWEEQKEEHDWTMHDILRLNS